MKRKILIIALCLVCSASFAQTSTAKKKAAAKGKSKTRTPAKPSGAALNKPASFDTTKKTVVVSAPAPTLPPSAVPAKPFERPLDGYYKQNDVMNAKVTPYASIREADVWYKRRVWREIDLREKMNQYLASPKARLIDVIMDAVAAGELTAYDATEGVVRDDPDGDQFSTPLTPEKAKATMTYSATVDSIDKKTGDKVSSKIVAEAVSPDSIVRFRIKEDWMFDKQRSVWEPRIIGLAPMIKKKVNGANLSFDYQPAFWIYFKDARKIFVTKEVVNNHNDATGLSFDDAFTKRIFTGPIVKVSNDKNDAIKYEFIGIDRLYEAERIKKSLMDWELNLWQY